MWTMDKRNPYRSDPASKLAKLVPSRRKGSSVARIRKLRRKIDRELQVKNKKLARERSPSDFAGSWSMSDKEEKEIMHSLDRFWKGWSNQKNSQKYEPRESET